ncbi:hypothetical protein [Streptomyces sp. NPDC005283]
MLKATAVITARATQALSSFNLDLHGLAVRKAVVKQACGTDHAPR